MREVDNLLKGIFNNHWEHLSGNLTDIADIEAVQTATAFESVGLGVSALPTTTAMSAAISTNPLQVSGADGGALLDEFVKGWTKTERKRIVGTLRKGYVLGQTNAEILQTIRGTKKAGYKDGILAQTDRHTKTMIRTAIAHVANTAKAETHKELGVAYEQLDAKLDRRTTPICRALDKAIYKVGKGPQPPLHYNCRTVLIPYIPELAHLNDTRASEFGYAKNEQYYTWLKRQTPKYQDEVLGKGRGKLFRSEGMTPERFRKMQLDRQFKEVSLNDLKRQLDPHFIEPKVDTKALAGARFQPHKLKRKFKHAEIFDGIDIKKSNPKNWKQYQNKIIAHLNDESTEQFGFYRNDINNKVYYNKTTGVAVAFDKDNVFITAYIPSDEKRPQLTNFLKTGNLQ